VKRHHFRFDFVVAASFCASLLTLHAFVVLVQVRLNGVATFIGMVGLSVALAVLVVLLAR
jgi:hypothetical protein